MRNMVPHDSLGSAPKADAREAEREHAALHSRTHMGMASWKDVFMLRGRAPPLAARICFAMYVATFAPQPHAARPARAPRACCAPAQRPARRSLAGALIPSRSRAQRPALSPGIVTRVATHAGGSPAAQPQQRQQPVVLPVLGGVSHAEEIAVGALHAEDAALFRDPHEFQGFLLSNGAGTLSP